MLRRGPQPYEAESRLTCWDAETSRVATSVVLDSDCGWRLVCLLIKMVRLPSRLYLRLAGVGHIRAQVKTECDSVAPSQKVGDWLVHDGKFDIVQLECKRGRKDVRKR